MEKEVRPHETRLTSLTQWIQAACSCRRLFKTEMNSGGKEQTEEAVNSSMVYHNDKRKRKKKRSGYARLAEDHQILSAGAIDRV